MMNTTAIFNVVNERIRILREGTKEELLQLANEIGFEDTPNNILQLQINNLKTRLESLDIDWTKL
jgi:hypothetical protein